MKLRSTTPLIFTTSFLSWVASVTILAAVVFGCATQMQSVKALSTEEQIAELNRQISDSQNRANKLGKKSDRLTFKIDDLKKRRQQLERSIADNQRSQSDIIRSIAKTKIELEINRRALGKAMADAYVESTVSPIEILAGSSSIGEYMDRQVYYDSVNDALADKVSAVKANQKKLARDESELRVLLAKQRVEVVKVAAEQKSQVGQLVALDGESAKLTKLTSKMIAERKKLQQDQQQFIAASLSGAQMVAPGSISEPVTESQPIAPPPVKPEPVEPKPKPVELDSPEPTPQKPAPAEPANPTPKPAPKPKPKPAPVVLPNGGYPAHLMNCHVDANAFSYGYDSWGYGCRQCVSYVAWKVLEKTGKAPMYWGNANQWPANARSRGYKTGSVPRPKSIGVMNIGYYGHVVWVESINKNGTLNISQYNAWLPNKPNGGWGWYSEYRGVKPSAYQTYIYV